MKMGQGPVKYENLSIEEIKRIRDSWMHVRKKLSKIGVHVFSYFFERYPQHKKYFSMALDNIDDIERHSVKFLREISQIIRNIESVDSVLYMVRLNALNHRKFHIDPVAYDDMRTSFIVALKEELDVDNVNAIAIAWDKGLKIIFQIITDINYEGPSATVPRVSKAKMPPRKSRQYDDSMNQEN